MFLDLYKFRLVGLSNRKVSQRSGYYCDSMNAKPDKDTVKRYNVYAELVCENENQHRDKSNNLPNVLSFVTRYLVRRGD